MGKKFVGLNGLKYFWNKIKVKIEEAQKTVSDKIAEVENSLTAETTARENADKTLQANIENKVDKVNGKGLSTNDYTTEEKNKLSGLDNYDDTAVKSSITDLQTQITSNKTAIESEEKRATTAENNLSTSISSVSTNLSSHTGNKSNPHGVTKSQVGLGNVPNVATNDQTPTYTVASENTALTSGEKLSVAFGKIAKAISSLISHLANKSNPHGVTKAQVGLGNVVNTGDSATPTSGGITKFTTGGAYTLKQAIDKNTTAIATLNGTGTGSVTKTVSDKIAEVVAGAPESLDTLKEISDWIDTHEDSASAMNTAIQANATAISDEAKARAAADTALQTAINGKAASSHTHDDRYYTETEIDTKLSGKADKSHTHTKSQITDFPTSLPANGGTASKVANSLTFGSKTFNGSSAQTITASDLGALTAHQTIKQDGITGATVNRFGTCSTAADTAAKTVSITTGTFSLEAGARVSVKFSNANTASTPTLNVASKGAKNIFHKGVQITTGGNKALLAGVCDFIYDGTQWHLVGNYIDTTTTYSNFVKSGSGAKSGLVPAPSTTAGTTKYLREDGTWKVPPDTNTVYTHPTTPGNKHIPSGGLSGQILHWSADGTAVWGDNTIIDDALSETSENPVQNKVVNSVIDFLNKKLTTKANKGSKLQDYGITDAYTREETNSLLSGVMTKSTITYDSETATLTISLVE